MNELRTLFIFDDTNANQRIDQTERRLYALDTDLNNLGKGLTFGKTIADDLSLAGKSVEDFKTKANGLNNPTFGSSLAGDAQKAKTGLESASKGADDLKKKTDDLSKPTFGGEYYEESKKVNEAWKTGAAGAKEFQNAAETSLKSTKGLADAGANSLREIGKFYDETSGKIAIPTSKNSLYEEIEKSRLSVKKLNSQKLDGKNFDGLRQAGNRIESELAAIQKKIVDTERLLKNTKDKTVISKLNEDLTIADDKYSRLLGRVRQYENARQPSVSVSNSLSEAAESLSEKTTGGRRGRISETQRTLLEIADDFVPAGFNRPFNAVAKEALAFYNTTTEATVAVL